MISIEEQIVSRIRKLSQSSKAEELEEIEGLLEVIEDINWINKDADWSYTKNNTFLTVACQTGNEDVVNLLLEYGANPDQPGTFDCTPLYIAIEKKHFGLVKILLQHGANIHVAGEKGRLPLDLATGKVCLDNIKMLWSILDAKSNNKAQNTLRVLSMNNIDMYNYEDAYEDNSLFLTIIFQVLIVEIFDRYSRKKDHVTKLDEVTSCPIELGSKIDKVA